MHTRRQRLGPHMNNIYKLHYIEIALHVLIHIIIIIIIYTILVQVQIITITDIRALSVILLFDRNFTSMYVCQLVLRIRRRI